ncbi:MAG: helix-turn-helix domain-containing protein [Burkholderiaceae bacterium]|nr:helix-turn-helix domain-containing protein [Burkholderiaceae bacterium]
MPEEKTIPQMLYAARLARGMELDSLARKTGVARNHLVDIEAGSGRSFHSLVYCRKAVAMVAREFGLEEQVAAAWRDEDWIDQSRSNPKLASLEASPPALLPSTDLGDPLPYRRWLPPLVGLLGLGILAWIAIGRMDREPDPSMSSPILVKGPESTDSSSAPVPPAAGPAAQTTPPATGPVAASAPSLRNRAESAMLEWNRLWRSRQAEAYSALYDPGFAGLDRHLGIRRQRMMQATFVEVDISELQYRETGPGEVTVRFRQVYRSDNYQSDDRKEIVWRQTPQGLKIIAERLVN